LHLKARNLWGSIMMANSWKRIVRNCVMLESGQHYLGTHKTKVYINNVSLWYFEMQPRASLKLGMLFHEHMSVNDEQVNMSNWTWVDLLEYSTNVNEIFGKYSLTHEYFMMWKNILPHDHGWMIFMDENVDDKWKWMKFFMNVGNIVFWWKIEQKNRMEKTMLVYFEKFNPWNVEVTFEGILYINLILIFVAFKSYRI
jgi:hypothetical protein